MQKRPDRIQPMESPKPGVGKGKVLAALLSISAAGFAAWQGQEGFTSTPVIPTKGDVPTIGHGSTRYEDGRPVRMSDPAIDRKRAAELARNLISEDERSFKATIPGVRLSQPEYDIYINFVGQFGIGNWRKSSMRTNLLAGNHVGACRSLLKYRFAGGYDCSTMINGKPNKRCWGVWERQKDRFDRCMEAQ